MGRGAGGRVDPPQSRQYGLRAPLNLPVGTTVVIQTDRGGKKSGTGGIIRADLGEHRYTVEFLDGTQAEFAARELAVAKRALGLPANGAEVDMEAWRPYVVYRVRTGSSAFGLAEEGSDTDVRGCFIAPAEAQWGLFKPPEHLRQQTDEQDEHYWEIERYLHLLLKNDCHALETLWSPLVLQRDPLTDTLRAGRRRFLSKRIYYSFIEYAFGQLHKLDRDINLRGEYRFKHATHLLRLLLSVEHAFREGDLQIDVGEHRATLLAIKHGEWTYQRIVNWAEVLRAEAEKSFATTRLPAEPNFTFADAVLRWARRRSAGLADDEIPRDLLPVIEGGRG